jgi:XTP/dITP diphosphohydrolase
MPKGYSKTVAELSEDEKNTISHRALALKKVAEFLENNKL